MKQAGPISYPQGMVNNDESVAWTPFPFLLRASFSVILFSFSCELVMNMFHIKSGVLKFCFLTLKRCMMRIFIFYF